MNFIGKFDAKLPVDGPVAHSATHAHVDGTSSHAPSDAIVVPDAQLLFGGEFKRSGVDLVLSDDHHELVLHDYFKGEKRVALASPDGAQLTGDLVNALAGHVEYAQADGAAAAAIVVGHVTKLTGTATAVRNGVSIILNQGDNIDKGDVLQSGADSTLGVTFIDGTVFGLSSNARMVVNEMIYDPNGSNNSSLLSLVAGTISFVAGETAKHGDMKVDTPVATMGIRGTAVLVEIDFSVPGANGAPSANFQVLVEPDGTTGSYILFDKNTLAPLATVNTAGTLTKISQGIVSFEAGAPLTPDQQNLITELFTTKFGDSNTKSLFDHFTDSIVPQSLQPVYLPGGVTVTAVVLPTTNALAPPPSAPSGPTSGEAHIPVAPHVNIYDQSFSETPGVTGSHALHTLSAPITFTDPNSGDRPTVTVQFASFTYQNAQHNDISASLSSQEQAAIAAVEGISLQTVSGNDNNGSAIWTYSFPDDAFDFLGAGETLTLTYTALVDNNYASDEHVGTATFTITITGTNDVPVITSGVPQTIAFAGGTSVAGGDLTAHVPTSGTISFDDPDLTDTHTVSVKLLLNGLDLPPTPLKIFENALTASIAADSTGTGFGTINWKLADLPVYLGDFIPKGETITLIYAVTVTDSQGATATQDITVTITGTDTPAVVWIATTTTGSPPGGLWSDALNWETGTVPTAADDAIIITDQLIGLTPSYPVTIDADTAAAAKSVTMNDYGTSPPKLINLGSLAVGGAFNMSADSILNNSGTISVGGLMEVLDTSVLQNSGTLTLEAGGDFAATTTITNTGTIEVSGGTLTVEADVDNGGGSIVVDGAGALTLNSGAINGGAIDNSGTIDVFGSSAISNAHLNNGHVTIASNATLTLDSATVDGGIVTNDGMVDLTGAAVLKNGTLTGSGQINVSGFGNALDNESVTIEDALTIMPAGTLTIDQGSIVTNAGTIGLDDGGAGIGRMTLNDATIDGGSIINSGAINLTGGGVLENGTLWNFDSLLVSGLGNALHNETINVGGILEILPGGALTIDQGSTVTNPHSLEVDAGTLTLNDATINTGVVYNDPGGIIDLAGGAVLKNGSLYNVGQLNVSGTGNALHDEGLSVNVALEVLEGGALTIDQGTSVTNSGGTVTVDGTATLTLNDAPVKGGTVTNMTNGTIDLTGTAVLQNGTLGNSGQIIVNGAGNALDNEKVTNAGAIEILALGTLTLDQLTTVANAGGTFTIDGSGTLALNGATISGGTITDNGTIHVTGASKIDGNAALDNGTVTADAVLTLDNVAVSGTTIADNAGIELDDTVKLSGGASINGASSETPGAITNNGTLEVAGAATLLDDTLTNTGATVQVDSDETLTLGGTEIIGGTITDNGTIHVTGASKIDGHAELDNGTVTVDAVLTLDNVAVSATTIADNAGIKLDDAVKLSGGASINGSSSEALGAITNNGTLEVAGAATLLDDTLTNTGAIVQVDGDETLTLNGTEIIGGTITDNGTIHVTGASKIDGHAELDNGTVTVDAVLTLDNVAVSATTIADNAGIELYDTVKLSGGASINGASTEALGAITNNGTLEVAGAATLLDDTLTDTGATVQVDSDETLTLNGTEIIGGTITDNGTIHVTGASKIDGNAALDNGTVTADAVLTLDNVAVSATTIADNAGIKLDDAVKLSGGASINGSSSEALGAITNNGTLEVAGPATLLDDTLTNTGAIVQVDGDETLTLNGTEIIGGTITDNGTIHVTGASKIDGNAALDNGTVTADAVLTLDNVAVSGTTIADNAGIELDDTVKLSGGASINGASSETPGAITNNGTLEVAGAATLLDDTLTNTGAGVVQVDDGTTLTLSGVHITGGTINDGTADGAGGGIDVTADSTISDASLNNGSVKISQGVTLTLDDVTVTGTSIEVDGIFGASAGKLILQDGASLIDGQLTIDAGDQATLNGASITGGTITNNGTIDVTGLATFAGVTLNGAAGGTGVIDNTGTLTIGSGGITLAGSNYTLDLDGSGTIELNGKTIKSTVSDDTLVNNGNTIYGTGQIGTGKDGTQPLNVNNVSGTIEAIGGTLSISNGTYLTNSGLLEAASTGILDFTIGDIKNDGTDPLASSNASGILVDGILEIDNPLASSAAGSLSLEGHGVVALAGGTIEGNSINAETLFNINNLISGYGHIGLGTDQLTLQNEAHGVIDANISGQIISIDTLSTVNAGTIEATGGGAVDFASDITNSGSLNASDGSKLAFSNETIANTGSINVDGSVAASQIIIHGTVTLDGGDGSSTGPGDLVLTGGSQNAILSDLHAATLINVDNTISGSGSIGDAYLTVENDQHGVIDATGILALNAVSTVNAGLLEATSGGTLQIEGSVGNSGLIEANGGKVFVDSTATITGTASVTITNGGVAEFAGSPTQPLVLNATFSGSGTLELDNSQHYAGTVSGFGATDKIDLTDLGYSSSETDVWNSLTDTLTITDGSHSSNIVFSGSYDQNSFALTSDANGDTEVVLSPAQASLSPLDSAGNAVEGATLTAALTDPHASGVTYQWLDNGTAIAEATGPTYLPTATDLGQTLDVVVGFTDGGAAEHVTALAGAVAAPPEVAINADNTTVNENASLTLNGLNASFGDAGSDSITVTLDVIHGTLALDNVVGVSESGSGTISSPFMLTGTLAAIDTALASGLVYTPTTGYYGADTLTFEANDGAFGSNTAIASIDVVPLPPVFNSLTLTVAQGGTEVLTNADFSVTDPNSSSFQYTVGNVTGGQFEVSNGDNWVTAPTGGFTTAQIAAGQVEFVQDGTATPPNFSIFVNDGITSSPAIAPTVNFTPTPPPTAAGFPVSVEGSWSSFASTLIQNDSAPNGDGFTVSGATLDGMAATFNQADHAYEVQGTYGELYIYTQTVSGVNVGGFVDATFHPGDFVFVLDSNPEDPIHGLAPGATLADTFTYTITDSVTGIASTPATVTLNFADSDIFTGTSGANWTDGNSWMFGVPASGGIAYIGAGTQVEGAGAIVDGVTVDTADTTSEIVVGTDGPATLTLEGGTTVTGGTITIKDGSTLDTEHGTNGPGATLDAVVVHNSGTVQVGTNADHTATLTLDDGATITGGTLTVADDSTLEVAYGQDGTGATLDGVSIGNSGTIQIGTFEIDPTLTFDDGTSVTGGTLSIGGNSTLNIDNGPNGGAILDGVTVHTADSSSTIAISDGATLTLYHASIDGGVINDYSGAPGEIISGDIDVTGSSTISNASLNYGNVTIENGQTLTLDDVMVTGTSFAFVGSGTLAIGQPSMFSGQIAGISGSGDVLDLGGFDAVHDIVHASSGSYDSDTNTTSLVVTDTTIDHSVTLTLAGDYSTSTWTVTDDHNGGVDVVDPPAPVAATIASGSSLEISTSASTENISFQSSTGSLALDHPEHFSGVISGFTGDGTLSGSDQIDLKGIDYNSHSFTESYDATNDTLSVSDGSNSAVLHFNGSYQAANFSFTTDNNGGTIVYDPPVTDHPAAKTQAVTATNHGFVFNFADHGNGASGAHPAGETYIFDGQTFVSAEADLSKPHDDGHGHTAPAFDGGEPATVAAIKAQLHAHDFHFV